MGQSRAVDVSMSPRGTSKGPGAARIRQQLDRILASVTFQKVERLKRFISFIVSETVAGRGTQLKEYVVGTAVFEKDPSFDPRNDPIVRVQARRLRVRLDHYFQEEGGADEVIIELPKGGYVPSFRLRGDDPRVAHGVAPAPGQNTIAVLSFKDHSEGGALGHVCLGIRDELVHRLTQLPALKVIARDPSERIRDRDPIEAARAMGAAMALTGTVMKAGKGLRATAQLADTVTGCCRWSDSIDIARADVLAAQTAVAETVVKRLAESPSGAAPITGLARPRENPAAYNLYRQARYHLDQRSEEGLLKAADFFHKALAEDPQYALALSGLADAYGLLTHYGVLPPREAGAKASASALAAVSIDANSVEARTSLAHVKSTQGWDWRGAEQEFLRAFAIDPRYPTARHWYAMSCLAPMGRLDEALEQIQIAQSLDPVSAIISRDLALVRYYRREFDVALEQCDHTIELNAHFSAAYWALGLVQEQRGDIEEAVAALQRAVQLSPQSPKMNGALGRALAVSGQPAQARRVLKNLRALARDRFVSPFEFALIFLALGDLDEGFSWLGRAVQDRSFDLTAVNVDPRFDSLRTDKRFRQIARKVGLT